MKPVDEAKIATIINLEYTCNEKRFLQHLYLYEKILNSSTGLFENNPIELLTMSEEALKSVDSFVLNLPEKRSFDDVKPYNSFFTRDYPAVQQKLRECVDELEDKVILQVEEVEQLVVDMIEDKKDSVEEICKSEVVAKSDRRIKQVEKGSKIYMKSVDSDKKIIQMKIGKEADIWNFKKELKFHESHVIHYLFNRLSVKYFFIILATLVLLTASSILIELKDGFSIQSLNVYGIIFVIIKTGE